MGAMLYLDIVWLEGTRSQTGCEYVQYSQTVRNKCNISKEKIFLVKRKFIFCNIYTNE